MAAKNDETAHTSKDCRKIKRGGEKKRRKRKEEKRRKAQRNTHYDRVNLVLKS